MLLLYSNNNNHNKIIFIIGLWTINLFSVSTQVSLWLVGHHPRSTLVDAKSYFSYDIILMLLFLLGFKCYTYITTVNRGLTQLFYHQLIFLLLNAFMSVKLHNWCARSRCHTTPISKIFFLAKKYLWFFSPCTSSRLCSFILQVVMASRWFPA